MGMQFSDVIRVRICSFARLSRVSRRYRWLSMYTESALAAGGAVLG